MNLPRRSDPAHPRLAGAKKSALLGIALACASIPCVATDRSDPKTTCESEVSALLRKRADGDLSAGVLADLARNLDCSGRIEEAVGATFMDFGPDTAGRTALLKVRIRLLRKLGLDDVARQTGEDLGLVDSEVARTPGPETGSSWIWDSRPSVSGSLGWIDQFDRPHSAILPLRYSAMLDASGSGGTTAALPATDSVVLEGGSLQISTGLSWGGWSENGGFSLGPSGSVALPDGSPGWRSASGGLDLNVLSSPWPSVTLLANVAGSRSWFQVESGPIPTQDDLATAIFPTWKHGSWSVSGPQSLHAFRTNSSPFAYTGSHSLGLTWTVAKLLNLSTSGSGGWYHDPSASQDIDMSYQVVLGRRDLAPGTKLYNSSGPVLMALDSILLQREIDASTPETLTVPSSRRQGWKQAGIGIGLSAGPWHGVTANFSGSWSRTSYSHAQSSYFTSPAWWYYDDLGSFVVFRDTATGQDYVVKSISPHGSPELVPATWTARRRDDCWTLQSSLHWKPMKWLGTRAAWTWTRNISNLGDYLDGASYVRNVISLSSTVSW